MKNSDFRRLLLIITYFRGTCSLLGSFAAKETLHVRDADETAVKPSTITERRSRFHLLSALTVLRDQETLVQPRTNWSTGWISGRFGPPVHFRTEADEKVLPAWRRDRPNEWEEILFLIRSRSCA